MAAQHRTHAPGWYPDPHGAPDWRWWDGNAWTAHVAPRILPVPANEFAPLAHQHAGRLAPLPQAPDPGEVGGVFREVTGGLAIIAAALWQFVATPDRQMHGLFLLLVTGVLLVQSGPQGWAALWRRWRILDTPTVDAAGARPGLCEIAGRAELPPGRPPVVSMLSHQPTIGWRVDVERLEGKNNHRDWITRWSNDQTAMLRQGFLVRSDGGGTIVVRVREPARALRPIAPVVTSGTTRRVVENGLVPGDRVFCLGEVTMDADGELVLDDPDIVSPNDEASELHRQRAPIAKGAVALVTAVVAVACNLVAGQAPSDPTTFDANRPIAAALTAVGILGLLAAVLLTVRWWNRLIAVREQVRAAWGHIEVDLQRRHDTIGRLVTVVKQAAAHEGATLGLVATARHQVQGTLHHGVPDDPRVQSVGADIGAGSGAERTLLAVAERHPELRTHADFARLFDALVATENRIAAGRRFYNDAITLLDQRVDRFPGLLVRRRILPRPRPTLLRFTTDALPAVGHPWAVPPPPGGVPRTMAEARVPTPPAPPPA